MAFVQPICGVLLADSYPSRLKQSGETCVIVSDKEQYELVPESLGIAEQVESGEFSHSRFLMEPGRTEFGRSNWFPVHQFHRSVVDLKTEVTARLPMHKTLGQTLNVPTTEAGA